MVRSPRLGGATWRLFRVTLLGVPEEDRPYRRRSARVLLLDGADRILLFRLRHGKPRTGHYWITPGGGVGNGEPPHEAAARELREETGLVVASGDLGACVATTSGYADLGWATGVFRDDFFFHRIATEAYEVDTRGFEKHEREQVTEHRWWTVADLGAITETVYPFGLVPLLTDLLAGRVPVEPINLPWHL